MHPPSRPFFRFEVKAEAGEEDQVPRMRIVPSRTLWGTRSSSRITLTAEVFGKRQAFPGDRPVLCDEACKRSDLAGSQIVPEVGIGRVEVCPFEQSRNRLDLVCRPAATSFEPTTPRSRRMG